MFQLSPHTPRGVLLTVAALAAYAAPTTAYAQGLPLPPPKVRVDDVGDHLTVTVSHAGRADGTYRLRCHPGGGSHPDPGGACGTLDRRTVWGRDPFAPVAPDGLCTMQYGGPATAYVTGTWAGRPVNATYDRSNGCQIARWNDLVPLLPDLRSPRS
ncbi:SSI family serine proteinase inhibitor [Streptomyces avermitilis]|uniref:SSI family serine proteinase inhibitor n=1 Tax=Streptomyces avermitilis TaxID=33903 RepID=UPI0033D0BE2A